MTFPVTKFCAVAGWIIIAAVTIYVGWVCLQDLKDATVALPEFICNQHNGNYSNYSNSCIFPDCYIPTCILQNGTELNLTKELENWFIT